jgi:uncharacterized protein
MGSIMRTITLEEHYATPAFLKGPGHELEERAKTAGGPAAWLVEDLLDLGANRIAKMDEAGIDVQAVSLTAPGVEQSEASEAIALSRDANDYVADAVRRHSSRFVGFAALPTPDPTAAAKELERCIGAGFKGAMINGHVRGRHLDDRFFWPIFESAEGLGVPLYLHPARPPQAVIRIHGGCAFISGSIAGFADRQGTNRPWQCRNFAPHVAFWGDPRARPSMGLPAPIRDSDR